MVFFLSSLVAGVEFGEDKVTKLHISHVWKASSMNLTRKQINDQFKKEIRANFPQSACQKTQLLGSQEGLAANVQEGLPWP